MGNKTQRVSNCPGRFPELRVRLAETTALLADDGLTKLASLEDLSDLVGLTGMAEIISSDQKDPFLYNRGDLLRTDPIMGDPENIPVSILPLIYKDLSSKGVHVSEELLEKYPKLYGALEVNINGLRLFHKGRRDVSDQLGIDLGKIHLPTENGYQTLSGYHLEGDFGIGGTGDKQLVSGSPYMIYLVKNGKKSADSEHDGKLILGVAFWCNADNTMLIPQIQEVRGADLPGGVYNGVAGLKIAEHVARKIGFDRIQAYSAKNNPMFLQYPAKNNNAISALKQTFNKDAKTLGWNGTKGEYFELNLSNPEKNIDKIYTG